MCGLTSLSGVELFSLIPHYKMDTRLSGKKLGKCFKMRERLQRLEQSPEYLCLVHQNLSAKPGSRT